MDFIRPLCFFISMLLISIFLHEVGHIVALKKFGKRVNVKFKSLVIYIETPAKNMDLTNKQYKEVLLTGVLFGLFPSVFVFFNFNLMISILFVGGYLLGGSFHDIKEIIKLHRKEKKGY